MANHFGEFIISGDLSISGNTYVIPASLTTMPGAPQLRSLDGVSVPTDSSSIVSIYNEFKPTATSGNVLTTGNLMYADPSIAGAAFYSQVNLTLYTGGLTMPDDLINGFNSGVQLSSSSATINATRSNIAFVRNTTPGGTIDTAIMYQAYGMEGTNNGTTNNIYGFHMRPQGSGAPASSNRWGVFMEDNGLNYFAGKVGIGIVSPLFNLDIASASDAQIRVARSGGATLQLSSEATRAYFGTSSAHELEIIAGNSVALTIDDVTRNIGVGMTPNASYKLGVSGQDYGIHATANSGSGASTYGVEGYAAATGADNYGVIGEARTANSGPSGTNGRNMGVLGVAYAATGASSHNIGVYGAVNSINQLGGANEAAIYGFVGNGTGSPTTSHGIYLQNNQTNTANKYGGRITLANDQASGIGYGLHILQASTFTAGTAYGLDIDHSGTTPTKYGARIVVNGTSTTNYGLYIDSTAAATNYGVVVQNGTSIFNEGGGDYDFRVEGDTATNLLKVDAGLDRVGINEAAPLGKLHVSALEGTTVLVIDGMTDAGIVGVHQRYTKQAETSTTGTGTSTIATIAIAASGDRMTVHGMITAIAAGSVSVGGTIMVVSQNIAGTVTIVGTTSTLHHNSGGTPTFTAIASGTDVLIQVTGGGENTSWIMTYDYQIVNNPGA